MKSVWTVMFLLACWTVPALALLGVAGPADKVRLIHISLAQPPLQPPLGPGRTLSCDERKPQTVRIALRRVTVISFPFKPKDVVPGEVSFDFKQIKNDLVIKAMHAGAKTNLLVYLEDRRCVFELVAVASGGDDILTLRDSKDEQIEVPFHD
jgi:hypothetical protein